MDERVTIQQQVTTSDEYNQPVADWQDVATVWASVSDSSGGEREQADQVTAYMSTTFNIRFRVIDETMRILRIRNGRYYNIKAIKYPDRKRSLDVIAEMEDDPEEEPEGVGAFSDAFSDAFDNG